MTASEHQITFGHRIEFLALKFVAWWVNIIPLRLALAWGAGLGWLAWTVLGIRKAVVLINLGQAFPEKSLKERKAIGLVSYMNAGRFMIEFTRQKKLNSAYIEKHVSWHDPGHRNMIESLETGVIGLSFHHGNWEMMGVLMKYTFGDVAFLVGEQHNFLVDGLINDLRSSHGIELYSRDAAMRGVISSIRRKGMVCWLSDQDAGRKGLIVDFFGYPASTPRGAAAFSLKLKAPICCIFLERQQGAEQKLFISEPLYPRYDIPKEEAEVELTQRYTKILEERVRQRPDLYWWAHRRWKTTGLYRRKTTREGHK